MLLRKNSCLRTDQLKEKLQRHKLKHPKESYACLDLSFNILTNLSNIFSCLFSEINVLILIQCEISKICPGAFNSLMNMRVLNLNGNVLDRLPANFVIENRKLEVLQIFKNTIVFISPKFVDPFSNFRLLNLSWNNLCDFSNITMNKLEKLLLNNNSLKKFENNNMPNLKVLKLSENLLRQLTASMVDQLPSIEKLNYGHNEIGKLDGSIFERNCNLGTLKINNNMLKSLSDSLFGDGSHLQNLYLCRNQIEELHSNVFQNMYNLKKLFLNGNNLKIIQKSWFDTTPKLKVLSISNNHINIFEPLCFHALLNLEELYFNNNMCQDDYSIEIDRGLFNENNKLRIIEIKNSKIAFINHQTFYHAKNLEILDLSKNFLHTLPHDFLPNQANLKKLHLEHNFLNQFNLVDKKDQTENGKNKQCYSVTIEQLNLSGNPLTFFNDQFAGTLNLRSLILNGVSFKNLAFINFEKLPSLLDLKLVNCEIESFPLRYFWSLRKLKNLNLNQNSLSKATYTYFDEKFSSRENIDEENTEEVSTPKSNGFIVNRKIIFDVPLFSDENALKSLYFQSCGIDFLTGRFFQDLNDLVNLDLCDNELISLEVGVFDSLSSLAFINLKCNKFEDLPFNPFEKNFNLKVIILCKNYITSLDMSFFEKLPNLEKVIIDEFCQIDNNHSLYPIFFNEI